MNIQSLSKRVQKLADTQPQTDAPRWFRPDANGVLPDEFRMEVDNVVRRIIYGDKEIKPLIWRGQVLPEGETFKHPKATGDH